MNYDARVKRPFGSNVMNIPIMQIIFSFSLKISLKPANSPK